MEKLQKKKWFFLIAAAVFLVIWAVLGFSSRNSGPEAVASKYEKAYIKLDTKQMVKCYAPEVRKEKKEDLEELGKLQGSISEFAKGKIIAGDVVYGKEKNTAEVSCAMIAKSGYATWSGVQFDKITLVKVGNKWYISE